MAKKLLKQLRRPLTSRLRRTNAKLVIATATSVIAKIANVKIVNVIKNAIAKMTANAKIANAKMTANAIKNADAVKNSNSLRKNVIANK